MREMVVLAVNEPEVPVMVMVDVAGVAVVAAVNVSALFDVVGLVPNAAVMPEGKPETARVTLPVNGLTSVTLMLSVPVAPLSTDRVPAEGASVKAPKDEITVSAIVVVAVSDPEVPVIVTVAVPMVAELLAVKVSTLWGIELMVVVGLGEKAAVTPLGNPEATRVTAPLNPFTSVTERVSVPLAPWFIDSVEPESAIVKLAAPVTVREIVVVAVKLPEVPVIVIVLVPGVAVLATVSVSTLVLVVGLVTNAAVTPVGRPDAASVTLPVNPLTSVTVMVSVALAPSEIDRVGAEGASVKLPPPVVTFTETALEVLVAKVVDPP